MRRMAMILGLGLILLGLGYGQSAQQKSSSGFSNGRAWKGWSAEIKLGYVAGLMEALGAVVGSSTDPKSPFQALMTSSLIMKEYVEATNEFYEEPANGPVPIMFGMEWAARKASGAAAVELEKFMERARAVAAKASQ